MGLRGTTCLLACLWLSPGPAASAGEPGGDLRQAWRAVDPAALDALRGGLVAPSGLHVSFGFERTVQVNGITVLAQRVQVADVARITPAEADQLATLGQPQVLRIGHFDAAATPSAGLVIQNALDGQRIQVQDRLDVGSNALGMLQALNSAQTLRAGTVASRGGL